MIKKSFFILTIVTVMLNGCSDYHNSIWNSAAASAVITDTPVTEVKAESITLSANTLSVKATQAKSLYATVMPLDAVNAAVVWNSADEAVATVSENGRVTGVKAGNTAIRVLTEDGSLHAECAVTVEALGTVCTLNSLTFTPDKVGNETNSLRFDTLQPAFSSGTISYLYAPVKYEATKVSVAATADSTASILITFGSSSNTPASLGSASLDMTSLAVGSNTVTITVTAENLINSTTYTVSVYRAVPVFKTGQTATSGITGISDDGALQKGVSRLADSARFSVDAAADEVTDKMTGLVWSRQFQSIANSTDPATIINSDSKWRIPNIRELLSLTDFGNLDTLGTNLNTTWGFSGFSGAIYSSMKLSSGSTYYLYYPDNGRVSNSSMISAKMLFVRATSNLPATMGIAYNNNFPADGNGVTWPSIRFHISGSTVIDNMTGLQWCMNGLLLSAASNWNNAMMAVGSYGGYSDWRAPNVNELESLVRYDGAMAAFLNSQGFSNIQTGGYWTSTSTPQYTNSALISAGVSSSTADWSNYAWIIPFTSGIVNFYSQTETTGFILPVRGFSEAE